MKGDQWAKKKTPEREQTDKCRQLLAVRYAGRYGAAEWIERKKTEQKEREMTQQESKPSQKARDNQLCELGGG